MTEFLLDENEHTHAQTIPFLVWAILVGMVLLAGSVGALSGFIIGRVHHTDNRAMHDREAICTVLLSIRPAHRSAAIRQALQIEKCDSLRLPPVAPPARIQASPSSGTSTPHPTARGPAASSAGPRRTIVIRSGTPKPGPTVTRTVRPAPPPSRHPMPPASPSPSPRPLQSCLRHPLHCLP